MHNSLILGTGLSSLVAALTLSDDSSNEVLIFMDGKSFGAHFMGQKIDGFSFDNGMIYLEPASNVENSTKDITRPYNPELRYDWTRFGRQLNKFLSENISLRQVDTPLSYIDGAYYPDLLIADRLDAVADIISSRGPSKTFPNSSHPKYKNIDTYWDDFLYVDAAKIFHGEDLSELIENSFFKKFCPPGQLNKILAKYHRMLWLPLFYPETIQSAMQRPKQESLKEYKFFAPSSGFVGEFVQNLVDKLKVRKNVNLYPDPIKSISIDDNHIKINSGDLYATFEANASIYSSLSMDRLLHLSDENICANKAIECTGVHLCYAVVKKEFIKNLFSTLNILDSSESALRISNMDTFANNDDKYARVTIEYPLNFSDPSGGTPPGDDAVMSDIHKHIFRAVIPTDPDAIRILKKITLNKALALPTLENLAIYKQLRQLMTEKLPLVNCFASASHYGAASMNDQIIQGLSIGKNFYE